MSQKTVPVFEANVLKAYNNSPCDTKKTLEDLFGKEIFNRKITDRVKTFVDACEIAGIDPYDTKYVNGDSDTIAYEKLKVIAKVLNEGWTPNWNDSNQRKWYAWFYMNKPGFLFNVSYFVNTDTNVGSRLCYKSSELSTYAAKQFFNLYKDYYTTLTDNNE